MRFNMDEFSFKMISFYLDFTIELLNIGAERMGMTAFQSLLSDTDDGVDQRWKHKIDQLFKPNLSR